jgi:hypothetical protein
MTDATSAQPDTPRLSIHIGAAKCGSSAIQETLRRNAESLKRIGVLVPDTQLGTELPPSGTQVRFFEDLKPFDDARVQVITDKLEALRRASDSTSHATVIISAENLINSGVFAGLFRNAPRMFDVEVVAYIRRQDEFLLGAWNQWHFKVNNDLGTWLEGVTGQMADWDARLAAWEHELPDAKLSVRVFDRDRLVGGDVVTDFLYLLGVPAEALLLDPEPVNRGLNELAMTIAMRNRHLFLGRHDHRFTQFLARYGADLVTEPISAGLGLAPEQRRALVAAYAEGNERIRKRWFPQLPEGGLFSTDFEQTGEPLGPEGLRERELDLLWTILFRLDSEIVERP